METAPDGTTPEPDQPAGQDGATDTIKDLITRANEIFNNAQESQRAGNWAEYGKNIEELSQILERLDILNKEQ